ncbi:MULTISPECIES: TolC family protein [Methylotenera]|uniref:TolC family protein n=1 Tax=Methylotenera TaxID=359407 RepID=UPI0003692727|nr:MULTISPECIES: TolC family protein [Methylotenera]
MQFPSPKCLRFGIQNILISLLFIGNSTVIFADSYAPVLQSSIPATQLTLKDALNLALNANPEIAVAIREREAIEGIKAQAATRPNPSLSTSIQDTRSANRQTFLQFNQEIELGNKREARIEAADSFYTKAEAELASKKAEIHANVITAFYTVLIAQERLTLAKSSLDIAELARDAASKRVKAGKSSPVEETKSKIAEASAKIEFNQANTQLTNSRKRLATLWGSALPVFERVEGDVTFIPKMAAFSALTSQLDNAPAVKLANIEIDSRSALTKVERSKGTPNITISAGVVNNQELGGINQALLGLSIPIPVFDRNQGNLQEAVSRQYKAQDELVALKNQLEANLSGQYERLNAARQAAESLKVDILPSAQSAFDAANKGFNAGKFNFLDVLDAQRTLVQAKSQYINSLLDAHEAVAEIERILGDVVDHQSEKSQE